MIYYVQFYWLSIIDYIVIIFVQPFIIITIKVCKQKKKNNVFFHAEKLSCVRGIRVFFFMSSPELGGPLGGYSTMMSALQ